MLATDKNRLTAHLSTDVDKSVRIFAIQHDKNLSEVIEAMIIHCIDNPDFVEKLIKKEEEIDR